MLLKPKFEMRISEYIAVGDFMFTPSGSEHEVIEILDCGFLAKSLHTSKVKIFPPSIYKCRTD